MNKEIQITMPNGQQRILIIGGNYLINNALPATLLRVNKNSGWFKLNNGQYRTYSFSIIGNELVTI